MKLRFTHHARSQALARGIPEWVIAEAIRHSDSIEPAPGGAVVYQKLVERGIVEVVCRRGKRKNEYLVLTAYYR